jgi:hypothetical protein
METGVVDAREFPLSTSLGKPSVNFREESRS